ncbi:MAG: hypothetical protein KGY76_07635 [Candidatus Thermoplasmatota archaeon]|nr:hypothetical protein [Candidatus Thermoplasmatota archaeon]
MTSVELEVKKSKIKREGKTRICKDAFENLNLEPGDEIVVSKGEESVVLSAFTDELVEEKTIHMRKKDLTRLEVDPADTVSVEPYHSISEKLKEKLPISEDEED